MSHPAMMRDDVNADVVIDPLALFALHCRHRYLARRRVRLGRRLDEAGRYLATPDSNPLLGAEALCKAALELSRVDRELDALAREMMLALGGRPRPQASPAAA